MDFLGYIDKLLRKSHIVFGLTLLPTLLVKPIDNIKNSNINFEKINLAINNFNNIIVNIYDLDLYYILLFLIPFFIGTTFPDIDMKFKIFVKNKSDRFLYHRQITHSLLLNISLIYCSLYYLADRTEFYFIFTAFLLGIFTHLIADMLTGSIPIFLYGHYGKQFSRIGVTRIIPKNMHKIFTEKLPKVLNKYIIIIIIFNLIIFSIRFFI